MAPQPASATLDANGEETNSSSRVQRRITPEVLQEIIKERGMWSQPHLNTQMFLNYKGFEAIENLEDFVRVRVLYLGNNNISKIQGLDRMTELRSLHLPGNRITSIENLEGNLDLRQLDLETNAIQRVEGLSHLLKLEQLNLGQNSIERLEDLEGLKSLPLSNIDVSNNRLEDQEGVVEFWTEMDGIKVLRYHGNPGVRFVAHYRKRLINGLPKLSYLDDRTVQKVERLSSAAWATGGTEAMHKAKQDFFRERNKLEVLDDDRREHLTRQRKMAIARIEREEKEREEAEAANLRNTEGAAAGPAVDAGQEEALKEYEQVWFKKSQLYGADGLREKLAKDQAGAPPARFGSAATATKPLGSSAPAPSSALNFAPPSRAPPVPAARTYSEQIDAVAAQPSCRSKGSGDVSSFRERQPELRSTDAGDGVKQHLEDRQFAVMGDDPWLGTAAGSSWRVQKPGSQGLGGMATHQSDDHVVPDLWQKLGPAQAAAERQVLDEQRDSLVGGAAVPARSSSTLTTGGVGGNLNGLD